MTIVLSSPKAVRKMNGLVFAPSGHGKTTFLGTAQDDPRTFPMLVVDFEGGLSSIADRQIDSIRITKWDDFREVVRALKDVDADGVPTLRSQFGDHLPFKSIAVDSISESHIFALMRLLDDGSRRRTVQDLLDPGDYGQALIQMRRLLREFRDLPYHFFATALSKPDVDPRIGAIQKPALVGALADEAPGIFDAVMYMATQDAVTKHDDGTETAHVERVLVLQNIPVFRTKVRVPPSQQVPDTIVDPTVGKLLDAVGIA